MSFDRNPASSISDPQETASTLDGRLAEDSGAPRVAITQLELWSARFPDAYVIPVAGGVAGAVSGVVSCPLDVIKTKLQAQGGFKVPSDGSKLASATYHGVRGTAETIWREEGLRGMYRGLGPMLLGYVPTWAVYLTVYSKAQGYFNTKTGTSLQSERLVSHAHFTNNAYREQVLSECLRFCDCRGMLNNGHQSNLGN